MKRAYIVVEGPHDVEFVARLLKPAFSRVKDFEQLDLGWRHLVPTKFPHRGDLLGRVPTPIFLCSDTHTVALHSAQGIDNIARTLEESWALLGAMSVAVDGVGIVLDADDGQLPEVRYLELRRVLTALNLASLQWPAHLGEFGVGPPRCGTFIMPDNHSAGTLEDLLMEASEAAYPALHAHAVQFVQQVVADATTFELSKKDLKELRKPAGERKATIACIASLLRPGRSAAVAIQDCRWLEPAVIQRLPRVAATQRFLHQLLEL